MYLGWSTTKAGLVNTVKKKAMEIHLQSAFLYDMNLLHLDASKAADMPSISLKVIIPRLPTLYSIFLS
jgi:hypothetical protein